MHELTQGNFFGESKTSYYVNGLTIIDSVFRDFDSCPWHYHQNAHFAFTTGGSLVELHKRNKINLSTGALLYNHSQDPHCNSGYSANVSALHVDISPEWFSNYEIEYKKIEGIHELKDPSIKNIFFNLYKEVKLFRGSSQAVIENLVLEAVDRLMRRTIKGDRSPSWVNKVRELLYDRYDENIGLKEIASVAGIHPVYFCQQFPLHFHCSFGDYIRKIRIEKAVQRILNEDSAPMAGIAYSCGFADQSHFIRTFKKHIGVTPLAFKKMCRY